MAIYGIFPHPASYRKLHNEKMSAIPITLHSCNGLLPAKGNQAVSDFIAIISKLICPGNTL